MDNDKPKHCGVDSDLYEVIDCIPPVTIWRCQVCGRQGNRDQFNTTTPKEPKA